MARLAVNAQFAADKGHSLSHAGMAETRPSLFLGGIESNAIVVHRKLESAIDKAKANFYRAGERMTGDVPQGLLRMRYKHSAIGRGASRFSSALKLTGIASADLKRSHSVLSASINPRS